MIPTIHGLITCAIGFWLLYRGNLLGLFCAMLVLGLFEASAAVFLPALSNSSIPPARIMLLFLLMAVLKQVWTRGSLLSEAIVANASLIVFALYGMIGALLLPRIFAGQIEVVPMRAVNLRSIFDAFPLAYSAQNITTGAYLVGGALTAVAAYVVGRLAKDLSLLAKTATGVALAHAITGLMGALLAGTPWDDVVSFIRNGSYAQLTQMVSGFLRINGFMAEPSSFARFGIVWVILTTEMWLRNINPRWNGIAAMALTVVLILSASSTAYLGLGGYALVLAARSLSFPSYLKADKVIRITLVASAGIIVGLVLVLVSEGLANELGGIFERMTVNKSASVSGQQRQFWAMQGVEAFKFSGGLGIGAGSFRSSSLVTAIIGSLGVIGIVTFVVYCLSLARFMRVRPASSEDRLRLDYAAACAWAALAGLIPELFIQPSPDPGMEFVAFAGLSLALCRPALKPFAKRPVLPRPYAPPAQTVPETSSPPTGGGWARGQRG